MSPISKITWSVLVIIVLIAALAAQVIRVRQVAIEQPKYTANSGEVAGDVLVGQTFTAGGNDLSGVSVMFATYSGRNNTEPVRFHLRSSVRDTQDIRSATAQPRDFGDNQFYRFEFAPVADSAGQQYFFFVEAPTATRGNAVAVDIDARDPHPGGSAYLARGVRPGEFNSDLVERSGKQNIDVAFATYHTVSLRQAIFDKGAAAYGRFVSTWGERKVIYSIWAKVTMPLLAWLLAIILIQQSMYVKLIEKFNKKSFTWLLLALLFGFALIIRYWYAVELPLTNDEGNYLYDARMLREGVLAGGDGYVKAPFVIFWIALWQMLLGNTIFAGRLSSIIIGALTLYPLYLLCRELWSSKAVTKNWITSYLKPEKNRLKKTEAGWGRRVGIVAAAMWAVVGAAIVFNIYVHTQPLAVFLAVSSLSLLLMALRGTTPRLSFLATPKAPSSDGWFFLAGLLMGMAVASRKSMLALGLVPAAFILLEGKNIKLRIHHLIVFGLGFLIVVGIVVGAAYWIYGAEGVWEVLGYNSAEDGIFSTDPAEADNARAYSLRGMTPFFRESLPLILLSLIGLGIICEQLIRTVWRTKLTAPSRAFAITVDHVIPKLGWIAPWAIFAWAWQFFFEYEGAAFMAYGITWLWYLFAVLLALLTIIPRPKSERIVWQQPPLVAASSQPGRIGLQTPAVKETTEEPAGVARHLTAALFAPLWIAGLTLFYSNWIKFHANYLAEFIPPLIVLSAFGVIALYRRLQPGIFLAKDYPFLEVLRRVMVVAITAIVLWSAVISNYITFLFEHTGTFQLGAIEEAASWARATIPLEDFIFTGAAAIPYVSGHRVVLDIAHPRWYAYEFTRQDTARLQTFLPSAENMVQAFRDAKWFLFEQQTGFSFLMEYSEIESGLERDFERVQGVANGSNTLTFYRRVR